MGRLTFVIVALRCAIASADVTIPPDAAKPLTVGFISGFISDKPDLMTCGMAAGGEVMELKQAAEHLEKALKSLNLTDVETALNETAGAVDNIPGTKATCGALKADLKALLAGIRKLHGPKGLIVHVLDNLVEDGVKIFDELEAADKAYKTGSDYMTAGKNLGMATRRMLVGEMNSTAPDGPVIPGCRGAVLAGVATGFISDSPRFLNCSKALSHDLADFKQAAKALGEGLLHMNWTAVGSAIDELSGVIKEAQDSVPTCEASLKVTIKDIKAIVAGLKEIHGPKDLVMHILDNLFSDGENIFGELASAAASHKSKDCMDAGRYMGMAFRRTLVGEAKPNSTTLIV